MTTTARSWGDTDADRSASFACDEHMRDADGAYFRAIDVDAAPATTFRWLCQLRVAPYSYDWIDNFGRRSPRGLIDGLDDLEIGQPVMTIFRLVAFERDRDITIATRRNRLFGDVAVTYMVKPVGADRSRIVVKVLVRYPRGLRGLVLRYGLPWGDLVMMRKQLRTLKALAEAA